MKNEEYKDTIFSDWFTVKSNIWLAWGKLIILFAKLVTYKLKEIDPKRSRFYISCCESLTSTYLSIGSRYSKHLEESESDRLKEIYSNTIKGIKPKFTEIAEFIELTEKWLDVSGMSKIEREQHDPGDSVLEDR